MKRHGYEAEEYLVSTENVQNMRINRISAGSAGPQDSGKPIVFINHETLPANLFIREKPIQDFGNKHCQC